MAASKLKAKKVEPRKPIIKPTIRRNSRDHAEKLESWGWDSTKDMKGWFRLIPTDVMSKDSDVILCSEWQYVDGFDGCGVGGHEVWRSEKLSGTTEKDYRKKHAKEIELQKERIRQETERLQKEAKLAANEAKILTKVSNKNTVEFSPTMEKLIKDFGCHETKVRNLMTRLFIEVEGMKKAKK